MGENSKIAWTDHTFNPWIGCTKIAPECVHCYAAVNNLRWEWNGGTWGPGAPRTLTAPENWKKPFRWNKAAQLAGTPARVFAASLADLFDDDAPGWPGSRALPGRDTAWLTDETTALDVFMHEVVAKTEWLTWLLLTKRFERALEYLVQLWGSKPWLNVHIIFSAGTQATVDRAAGVLRQVPASVRGLSMEPLLESVELGSALEFLDWVIIGGESGPGARPFDIAAARDLIAQCRRAGVAVFMKQMGSNAQERNDRIADIWYYADGSDMDTEAIDGDSYHYQGAPVRLKLKSGSGSDMAEWPPSLRVREFPPAVPGLLTNLHYRKEVFI